MSRDDVHFALRFENGSTGPHSGTRFWIVIPDAAESESPGRMPAHVRTFETAAAAREWAEPNKTARYIGRRAWHVPNGKYEVVPVRPRMVQDGWEMI